MEFQTVAHEGQRFVCSQMGEGPDVVLLHGFPDTPFSWSEIADALVGAGRRVTVPWLRGYREETIVPGRPYDPETLGRDALALLDALGIERAALVGHDWGALLTYVAAALEPQRVGAIATIDIPHPSLLKPSPRALWMARHIIRLKLPGAAWRCRRDDFAYLDVLYRRFARRWSGLERDEALRNTKHALSSKATLEGAISYYRDLPRRPSPVGETVGAVPGLIIGGSETPSVQGLFEATAALLPAPSRALVVEDTGHWPHRERSEVVIPELLSFLAEIG
ncbi:MAG TPA: alpha/beta hydrolase [Solirubrobacteraceae bacterium]|nr:alpha/beta hydrolase [Solirubrobacteraceae bacterium]